MKRTISKIQFFVLIFSILALLSVAGLVLADTGTYRILDYKVNLTPGSDGTVHIQYYQKWQVTGGHIPWITVGTANNNFTVVGYTGAASRVSSISQGGWSGVRLDLDRDYRAGEVFEVSFGITQRNLFYADQENYRLVFTPCWYDRAITDTLRITVKLFAKIETVKASPQPSATSEEELTWEKLGLGKGERFTISVSFPKGLFSIESKKQLPTGVGRYNLKEKSGGGSVAFIIFFVIFLVIMIIIAVLSPPSRRRGYSGGRIFYGGLFGGGSGKGGGSRSTGGGGGFGGASFSCACACVSCACACACAGGGGAGCSRKLQHSCPFCKPRRQL